MEQAAARAQAWQLGVRRDFVSLQVSLQVEVVVATFADGNADTGFLHLLALAGLLDKLEAQAALEAESLV